MKLLVIFLTASLSASNGQFNNDNYDRTIAELLISKYAEIYVQPIMKDIREDMLDTQCKTDLNFVYENLKKNQMWSYQMIDASAKLQTGVLTGNVMHLGNYDECIAINEVVNKTQIQGKYCSAFVSSNKNIKRHETNFIPEVEEKKSLAELLTYFDSMRAFWGVCVPKSCTAEDLRRIWTSFRVRYKIDLNVEFDDNFCNFNGKQAMNSFAIFTIIFLISFGIIIAVSTFYDIMIYQKQSERDKPNLIVAFSAYTNAKNIFSTKSSNDCLSCLNGIRIISTIWIIAAHRLFFDHNTPHINTKSFAEWTTTPNAVFFLSATFPVDTFFLISGLLLAYIFLQNYEKSGNFSLPLFYCHRVLRLTPSLAVLVLVYTSLFPYLGSGPLWPAASEIIQKPCERNWWATLLYIQNYAYPYSQCAAHTWYLAVDTQLYFFSPLILIPLSKRPRKILVTVCLLAIGSSIWMYIYTYKYRLNVFCFGARAEYYKFYISTHLRAAPWLIGIIIGYIMHKTKNIQIKINRVIFQSSTVIFMWILSLGVIFGVIFWHLSFATREYDVANASVFNSLSRPGWGLAVSWIILACSKGYGGLINKFFSLSVFNKLIKFNYNMYLLHVVPIIYFGLQVRTSSYFSPMLKVYTICVDVVWTLILGLVWTLAFESPVLAIERIIFKKGHHKKLT